MAYLVERDPLGQNPGRIMLDVDDITRQCAFIKNLKIEIAKSLNERVRDFKDHAMVIETECALYLKHRR